MDESRKEPGLPLRTLHEFLFEINREWDKFRTGSLVSIITSLLLFFLLLPRFFIVTLRRGGPLDKLFVLAVIGILIYNAYLAYSQHAFYRRWEKRMGLLLHLEEEVLGE